MSGSARTPVVFDRAGRSVPDAVGAEGVDAVIDARRIRAEDENRDDVEPAWTLVERARAEEGASARTIRLRFRGPTDSSGRRTVPTGACAPR